MVDGTENTEEIIIVVACDDNYAPYAATVLLSVCKNLSVATRCTLVVCTYGLNDNSRSFFHRVTQLTGREVQVLVFEDVYKNLPSGRYTSTMYLRYEVADRLPSAKQMLYLDCDVVVLQNLEPLLFTDLEGFPIAAAQDYADICGGPFGEHRCKIGLAGNTFYFNSGVLLADLEAWRNNSIRSQLFNAIHRLADIVVFPDQDALNVVLAGKTLKLDQRWNVQTPMMVTRLHHPLWEPSLSTVVQSPAIVHFTCHCKPWNCETYLPFDSAYRECLRIVYPKAKFTTHYRRLLGKLLFANSVVWSRTKGLARSIGKHLTLRDKQ